MFQIKNIHYNKKTGNIYLICISQKGLYYCSIYNVSKSDFEEIYFIGYKEKDRDTDYTLNNPSDISINPVTNDIAIAEYSKGIIRTYNGKNFKFIKNFGSIESFDVNSSNSNAEHIGKTMTSVTMRACTMGLRSLYRGYKGYKLSLITGISYSNDGKLIFVVDANGLHKITIESDVFCNILSVSKSNVSMYPYKVKVVDNAHVITSITSLNNLNSYGSTDVMCYEYKIINYINGVVLQSIVSDPFSFFDIGIDHNLYFLNKDNKSVNTINLENNDKKSFTLYGNVYNNNNRELEYSKLSRLIACGNENQIFIVYGNHVLRQNLVNDNYVTDFTYKEEEMRSYDKIDKFVRKAIKTHLKTKHKANNNNKPKLNTNIMNKYDIFTDKDKENLKALLDMSSNVKTVKKVYKELSKTYHPDKTTSENYQLYSDIFHDIKTLYNARLSIINIENKKVSVKTTKFNSKFSSKKNKVAQPWVPTGMNLVVRNS